MTFEQLLELPVYGVPQADKDRILTAELNELTAHHRAHCEPYARLLAQLAPGDADANAPWETPYLPVGLFKSHALASVPPEDVQLVMTSSGTTGQQVSRIFLDKETARRQTLALSRIMQQVLGPDRLPMLVIDARETLADRRNLSARGVGVLGMMNFGRQHLFALDAQMALKLDELKAFLAQHGDKPFLLFGFTFMVWKYLYEPIREMGLDLSQGVLIHSGGWKKLQEQAVGNAEFKAALRQACGLRRVHNFYGMVEQVGSVFLEGDDGHLHPPSFSDVIIRHPETWEVLGPGEKGLIQVVSALPRSYPGHSILTEDLGVVHAVDSPEVERMGKAFEVIGRLPRAELRGCSDTHAFGSAR
ncbi:MAG: acyl-protein synthetase [Acidobacteria bacterium]|nr:acyl-protein synthetase [Acidobacteriota bacterium]